MNFVDLERWELPDYFERNLNQKRERRKRLVLLTPKFSATMSDHLEYWADFSNLPICFAKCRYNIHVQDTE